MIRLNIGRSLVLVLDQPITNLALLCQSIFRIHFVSTNISNYLCLIITLLLKIYFQFEMAKASKRRRLNDLGNVSPTSTSLSEKSVLITDDDKSEWKGFCEIESEPVSIATVFTGPFGLLCKIY